MRLGGLNTWMSIGIAKPIPAIKVRNLPWLRMIAGVVNPTSALNVDRNDPELK
tara:strand:- start:86 stop:244 length:159 start_codon:yes stop_codon:yes gene_type:complete